jgi:hypothetical protein
MHSASLPSLERLQSAAEARTYLGNSLFGNCGLCSAFSAIHVLPAVGVLCLTWGLCSACSAVNVQRTVWCAVPYACVCVPPTTLGPLPGSLALCLCTKVAKLRCHRRALMWGLCCAFSAVYVLPTVYCAVPYVRVVQRLQCRTCPASRVTPSIKV